MSPPLDPPGPRGAATHLAVLVVACLGVYAAAAVPAAAQGRTHAVILVGLGGSEEYRTSFHQEASTIYRALIDRHGIPAEDVTYLGERVETDPEIISDRSTRANVLALFADIARRASPMDRLFVVMIGHGTSSGDEVQFNLPGPDLTPSDLLEGLSAFPTQTLALVHTGSASGGFVAPLSGPNRILVAATRTERQLNATEFGQFFAAAVAGEDADMDKDERVSLLEAYLYARREVERFYENENELLTETAVLDDNGDGTLSHDAGLAGPDGPLAATFNLGGLSGTSGQVPDDPELARLYQERADIQARIAEVRALRDSMEEDRYLDTLEPLLVELALKNREIRAAEGGGP
jgi:hypothetical protein